MKKSLISLLIVSGLMIGFVALATGNVAIPDPLNTGDGGFVTLLKRVINTISGIVASLSVIAFLWAGILFLISAGSPEKISKAKSALIYSIIGVTVALAAWGIAETIESIIKGS